MELTYRQNLLSVIVIFTIIIAIFTTYIVIFTINLVKHKAVSRPQNCIIMLNLIQNIFTNQKHRALIE